MADHAHPPQQASHSVNVAMAFCLLLVAGGIVAAVANAPDVPEITDESFELQPPNVDPERLAADRARHYPEVDLSEVSGKLDKLYEVSREANMLQFGQPDGKAVHDMQISTLHHANEVITKIGIEGFVPAGEQMFEQCADAFDGLLSAVQAGELTAAQASKDPGPEHDAYRKNCGNAFGPLLKSGVVTEQGEWADRVSGPQVFDIMNRFRWASVLDLRKPPWQQISPYEHEILTRWRAAIRTVPSQKRIEWVITAGRELPDFPTNELVGSLLFERGDVVGALGAYEEACAKRKRDVALQKKCEYLRTRVPRPPADSPRAGH